MRNFLLIIIMSAFLLTSCSYKSKVISTDKANVDELFAMMVGSYNSEKQATADSSFYNISLHMYPIWTKNKKSKWLYVEQALNSNQLKPYRQRIYELKEMPDGSIASKVYAIENQDDFIKKWSNPTYFDRFDQEILKEREGCTVFLKKIDSGKYKGSTKDKECGSTLRGAVYATSIVTVFSDRVESWDQGWDSKGEQVWGAVKSGYIFDKL